MKEAEVIARGCMIDDLVPNRDPIRMIDVFGPDRHPIRVFQPGLVARSI